MAKKTRKSSFAGKVGAAGRKAVDSHKADETVYDTGGELPAGIEGGIAQLVDIKFDVYKKGDNTGEFYFYAAGVVKQPTKHSGVPIEGLRTSIMEPMCDTLGRSREDVEAHLEWVLNELRKLGVDTTELDIDSLEDAAAALKEEQPHFRFRTWKGDATKEYPSPRVNHVWSGACEYTEDDEGEAVEDTTEDDSEEPATGDDDLAELGEVADSEDEDAQPTLEAQAALSEKAEEVGINTNDYGTWAEVATAIEEGAEAGEEDDDDSTAAASADDDDDDDWAPQKEEVWGYKPPKARKSVECEVTAVFASKRTCNLKSLDDGKIFKLVSWDKLEGDEE